MPAHSPGLLAGNPRCSRWGAPGEDQADGVRRRASADPVAGPVAAGELCAQQSLRGPPRRCSANTCRSRWPTAATVDHANLDYAATAPCLAAAADAVNDLLPWYASVHRGAGAASRRCTLAYEQARETITDFIGARADDHVIFTRNTTDALNLLARAVPAGHDRRRLGRRAPRQPAAVGASRPAARTRISR